MVPPDRHKLWTQLLKVTSDSPKAIYQQKIQYQNEPTGKRLTGKALTENALTKKCLDDSDSELPGVGLPLSDDVRSSRIRTESNALRQSGALRPRGSVSFSTHRQKVSWLQRRLNLSIRRRRVVSRVMKRLIAKRAKRRQRQRVGFMTAALLGLGSTLLLNLFVQEKITVGGVPYRIVRKFWQDPSARDAYFAGDAHALHDRLQTLGVEEDIKAFYRDRFTSEGELDRHIHQIMFDRTGYVGEAYQVNDHGRLVFVEYKR
ncbi:MAG: hypothetical protein AAFU53_05990 [Cyanobacteria bacterium J06632_3]